MSFDLTNDAERPQGRGAPGISPRTLRRARRVAIGITTLVVALLILWWARGAYTDWLWFDALGLGSVFTKILFLKAWLFIGGTLVSGAVVALSLYLAYRFSRGQSTRELGEDGFRLAGATIAGLSVLTVLIAAPVFGAAAAGRWETFLVFFNIVPFGVSDPQFDLDISFYVVKLRLFHFIQGWFMGLFIVSVVMSLALYAANYALRGVRLIIAPRTLKHLAALGVLLMISIALGHVLDVYEQVLSGKGLVFGASYTDVQGRIPSLWLMTAIAALAAVGFAVSNYYGGLRLMAASFSLWVIVVILANFVYPGIFQRLQVEPDEFARELPYIQRNIDATRAAYQIDEIERVPFQVGGRLDAADIREYRITFDNIRLWDLQPLLDAYNQLQFMELYYTFTNMDSDRYLVDGELRQVLLAARELDSPNLPTDAQNWVNRRLQYTHGYGVSMSPATGFSPGEGRPEYLLKDIPISGEFEVEQPELYYGESPGAFAIVNSSMTEVNPDVGFQHYGGTGGVSLNSTWRRFLYTWQFTDINILLSDQVTSDSRILYRRQIDERVKAIAPFLKLDPDPYPVLDTDGRLWWLQDAYTVTYRYPYSTRVEGRTGHQFNYIRNSVKVAVDAYNGDVHFYVMEPEDPLIQMYRRAFPGLFHDAEAMPEDLKAHMRYPVLQFSALAQMYLRYHVTDPQVFFNQALQWAIPLETRFGKRGVQMSPAYLLLQIPGQETGEFLLMLPFTPAGEKKNLVGWLAARNDGVNYGKVLSFQVPSDPQIDGPSQVEARIENDQNISQQFTLWEGAGSRIIRGQLLVIPVGDTIIYVEPLYLQSEVLAFPELKKIILADAGNVVMADNLNSGLAMLIGGENGPAESVLTADGAEPFEREELDRLEDAVTGMGEALGELQEALDRLRESMRGASQ